MNEEQARIMRAEIARFAPGSVKAERPAVCISRKELQNILSLGYRQAMQVMDTMVNSGEWKKIYVMGSRMSHIIPLSERAQQVAKEWSDASKV